MKLPAEEAVKSLRSANQIVRESEIREPTDFVVDDPRKNQFGGKAVNNGLELAAISIVEAETQGWYRIKLEVRPTKGGMPPKDPVTFYLHPTFAQPVIKRPVVDNVARLDLLAWGAFTVGAEASDGRRLELDLAASDIDAPADFKSR